MEKSDLTNCGEAMKSVLPLSNVCCTFIQTKQTGQPMSDTRINRQKFTMEMPSDFRFPIGRWMESMVIAWGQINHALVQIVFLKMPKMRLVRAVDGCGSKRKKTWINVCSCEHACAQHWKLVFFTSLLCIFMDDPSLLPFMGPRKCCRL